MLSDHHLHVSKWLFKLCALQDLDDFEALNNDPDVRTFFPGGVQTRAQVAAQDKAAPAKDVPCGFYRARNQI